MSIDVQVSFDKREILASGSAILTDLDNELVFVVADLRFVFEFRTPESDGPSVRSSMLGERSAKIVMQILDTPLPVSWHTDVIGHIGGRPVGIAIMVQTVTDKETIRLVNYTITAGAAA